MRELRVTSCGFGKTVEEVERRRFVKLKRCVLELAARGFLAIARRCRLNKSIRQRFAFTPKIQQMACAMSKPEDSYSYLESAGSVVSFEKKSAWTNEEFRSWTFSKANPTADDLSDAISAATQNTAVTQTSSSPRKSYALLCYAMLCYAMLCSVMLCSVLSKLCSEICYSVYEMAPSAPCTRAAAALRMKQIALDNQYRKIRRLRAQLATERRGLAATKKELEETQVALEASHKVIAGLTEIGLRMSKKIEIMKVKKQQVRANHVECHQKFQVCIHEAEDLMQAQHLIIEALVDEKDSLLQTIHGLQEANNAPAPFDGDWEEEPEEEPEEEEIEDIPLGEGEIDDE
ncbi:hypothetical protein F511_08311 [Dorcoceras hygrometricum]|uniref:Uncharacterized protein n=1 Tax=Dorcoceras hygrometricum TaxID=472368 RepID=A0A2Z7BBY2_9LAMI|nr:hypothetical protein F511_08311 [Dorcoceras hygrometricum]